MKGDFRSYCTKCQDYTDEDLDEAMYSRTGEDTYDFGLCHKHEKELWEFLGKEASFSWEYEECEECEECGEEFKIGEKCKCNG